MFERYLTDALTMHFGHLVENVDAEKVRLSAWSGKLVLEDLCLRTDALDHFVDKSPVEIAYGRVGKLDVQVPWSLVGAQLWKRKTTNAASKAKDENDSSDERSGMSLVLSDVNILITPRRKYDSKNSDSIEELSEESQKDNNEEREDIEATTQKGRERKEKAVQDLIYSQLLTRVAISASQSSSRWKWLQDCLSGLLSNLKITIRNIHIRYEDPGSCMGFVWNVETSSRPRRYRRAFSIGIKLGEFSVKTKGEQEMDAAKDSCAATGKSIKDSSIDDSATDYSSGDEGQEEKAGALPSVPSMNSDKELPDSYQTRRKVAAAEKVAIYWDSGGCCLISQMAPAKGDTMNGKGALERKYVDAAFSALNDGETEAFFPDESHYKRPHSYLLDPVSPSVHFKLLSQLDLQQGPGAKDNNDQANVDTTTTLPPSSIKIVLPQTEFSISRRTLEDAVYLRKSLSVWTHAKKGLLSEKTLKRLAKLRPVVSAVEDPRGWWKYTAEATIAFIKVSQQGQEPRNRAERRCSEGQPLPESRRSGWLGLAQALSQRKRYVALYKQLFSDQDKNSDSVDSDFLLEEKRARAHESLLELEDDLTAAEICAFRIFSYNALAEDKSVKIVQRVLSHEEAELDDRTSTSKWRSFWNKADVNTGERLPVEATNRLSLEHRIQSFLEMAHALLREKINSEVHEKEQKKHEMDHILERDSHLIDVSMNRNSATWDMSVSCQELSLQVNDQRVRTTTRHASRRSSTATSRLPVVRLSCACLAESVLYVDGSWEVECTIASLVMKDLTRVESSSNTGLHNFSNLVGPKRINDDSASEDMLTLGGSSFPRSVHVKVTRQLTFLSQDKELESGFPEEGSITKTQVRLYPLEVVYATVPVESLSRVLATVKTPELSDDYHRMAGRVYEWRDKQKKRLLKALAHKEKKIIVDVDITAPVLLIPETFSHMDSPMVVIDLGHVRFSNAAVDNGNSSEPITWDIAGFDDAWILALTNMQVQSTTALLFREFQGAKSFAGGDSVGLNKTRQIVEPFSLDFSILTAVAAEGDKSQMRINATLPRLSFNLMSSAVRLMCRLRSQWAQQKDEVNANEQISTLGIPTFRDDSVLEEANSAQQHPPPRTAEEQKHIGGTDRLFEFYFSAPLVTLQLENDVDERSSSFVGRGFCNEHDLSIPLIDLALRGMSGNLVQKVDSSGNISSAFEARLHSMDAIDLYQTAGPDYSLLLSSLQSQNSLDENVEDEGVSLAQYIAHRRALMLTPETDLVEVEYSSCARAFEPCDDNQSLSGQGDKASIKFHELYVEWNPETIAAVQEAMRTPTGTPIYEEKELSGLAPSDDDDDLHSDEEFFDAEEFEGDDVFFDTFLGTEKEVSALITPSHGLTFGSASPGTALEELPLRNNGQLKEASFCGLTNSITKSNATMPLARTYMKVGSESSSRRPFQMEFNLSKLRVNFNKESRHRRLMVAEMDRTYIKYETTCSGGSKTFAQLGNLIFLDPAASNSETLYGQILGLQADALTGSLLEMEVTVNPKRRQTIGLVEGRAKDLKADVDSVSICYDNGSVFGCDTMVRARFSPMRFVYLQQLWSEIVDYFFEGVMGYEVWGKQRPTATSTREISQSSLPPKSVNPFQVSFTRFEIKIESPVVLFPVQYRSTQFIRLNATTINVSNFFSCSGGSGLGDSVKWQNNCDLSFIALRLFSWDGREINHSTKGVGASVAARWPIGPLAPLIMPKYYITCNLGNLALSMRREDYALFQNLMAYNFGELSRNIDEWEALQNLTQEELAEYKNSVKVHFGYDKKDVAPTTYKVELSCPLFSISLMSKNESAVALMSCSNLDCEMKKDSDGISRQKVSCNVDLSCPKNDKEHDVLLSSAQVDNIRDLNKRLPQLKYTSISKPSGDNIKTLDIKNGCIYMVYPAWKKLSEFFTALPEAELLTAEEISLSVQIGDRWYRIGPSRHSQSTATPMATDKTARRFSWIGKNRRSFISTPIESTDRKAPSFQFRVTLTSPSIILPSSKTNYDASIVLRLQHLDFLHVNDGETITRSFFLHDLELYTSSSKDINRDHYSDENSLIKPWCVVGTSRRCTDKDFCTCKSHSLRVSADKLKARAAFSDMIIAIDVCLRLASDIRQCKEQDDSLAIAPNRSSESKENKNMSSSQEQNILKSNPTTELTALEWEGFELQVVDDSGRHFATSQELITLALGNISFSRKEDRGDREADMKSDQLNAGRSCEIALRLASIDVFDCLQVKSSPFRLLATSRPERNNKQWAMPTTPRSKITWDEYAMTPSDEWGFSSSVALAKRIPGLEFASNMSTQTFQKDSDSIFLRSYADELSINYDLKLNSFSLQWSPASVIATQRFLGRLKKQAVKSLHAFNEEIASLLASSETVEQTTVPKSNGKVKIVINFQAFTVCLNKEHQYRRLLQVSFLGTVVSFESDKDGSVVSGSVFDVTAWDCDDHEKISDELDRISPNKCVLMVTRPKESNGGNVKRSFLVFSYRTFNKPAPDVDGCKVPSWVLSHVSSGEDGGIDDYLEVSIATIELTYLKEKNEEIFDYLSNGLPGKGMGRFNKSAQGFLKKRIRTKSFLQVQIEAPTLYIPADELSSSGVTLRLGDMDVNSWFEGGTAEGRIDEIELDKDVTTVSMSRASRPERQEQTDWWRMLSLRISNCSAGVYARKGPEDNVFLSALNEPVDLSLVLQKSAWQNRGLSLRGKLSVVNMSLKYSEYCLINAVIKGNVGRKVDPSAWDNMEKAYDLEQNSEKDDSQPNQTAMHPSKHVEYASGARRIRYGAKAIQAKTQPAQDSKPEDEGSNSIDVKFLLDGFALKLHRDDYVEESGEANTSSSIGYDMILLRVQVVEVSIVGKASNDISLHLSLYRVGLFDLGDRGRLVREALIRKRGERKRGRIKELRSPCAFHVLVEGYSPPKRGASEVEKSIFGPGQNDAQLVITVDRVPATSVGTIGSLENPAQDRNDNGKVTIARVVVNFLTVNALIRPLKEVLAFFAMSWQAKNNTGVSQRDLDHGTGSTFTKAVHQENERARKLSISNKSTVSCLQIKIVLHYPRLFFVADESDPHSRALVLRGLAVVNAGRTTKSDTFSFLGAVREDIQDNLAVDAQLHSLESYINPDVYDALRLHERHAGMLGSILEDSLFRHMTSEEEKEDSFQSALGSGAHGVALLQPVTTGIEFDRSCRSRFPTRRHLSLNIEPISTMISFEDLQLIESVLERWSSEQKDKGTVQDELNAGENLAQGAMSGKADAFGIARNGSATGITQTYEVVFESKELGLGLRKDGDSIVVDEVRDKSYRGIIETGDVLILIGGRKLRSTSLPTVVHQLEEEARPAKMTFTRLSNTASSLPTVPPSGLPSERIDDVEDPKKGELQTKTFTLRLKRGIPHGLTFERSSIGDVAVVARVDSSLSRAIAENQGSTTAPQCGALVIKVKEEDCSEMGYDKTMHLLHELSSSFASDAGDYTVTFFEAESAVWGSHDHFYVSVSGAVFTCIDDLNGRDMPLLRGNLEAVDVRFEQGLGTSTTILDSTKRSPSIIHTGSAKHHDTRCDSTITLTAFAKIAVDYFHPRISVYEPFVESAQLCVILERHNANERIGRPGEIALEISDRILREPLLASSPGRENKPQLMCVNFTDAFAGVFFRALREWTAWRKSVISRSEASAFEEFSVTESRTSASSCKTHLQPKQNLDAEVTPTKASSLGTELSSELGPDGSRTSKHVAAQNVAQAALLFAQKRGADTGAKSESSKPFVLKNRTGVSIAFVQQEHGKSSSDSLEAGVVGSSHLALVGEYNGLERIEGKEAIELADGEDEAFHMNLLSDESVSNNDAAKRVRTYEGKFPLLAIAIQAIAGVSVEPLRDLQVFKAGSLIRHLSVRKSEQNGDSQDSFDSEGYPRFSIPLVWKVEVEDNRRILTLSSAVRIATLGSAFGIEVGIRIQQEEGSGEVFLENEDVNVGSNDPIQMIGFAQLDTPFYLPLWLALKFVLVRVYVRPRTTSKIRYSWGHRAVLQFGPFGVTKSNDWVWQDTFNSLLGSIRCGSITHGAFPAFLSCYSFGLRNSKYEGVDQDLKSPALPGTENRQVLDEMLSVYVGSGLTLRNMLPADIEWETAHGGNPRHSEIIDGTTLRRQDSLNVSPMENFEIEDSSTVLKCGDLADVFACSFQTETLSARFRLKDQKEWSKWALVSLRPQKAENEDSESGENNEQAESTTLTTIRQVNVQVEDDFGVPITFGLRIIPKVAKASEGLRKDVVFGVDVIVFAELWIGNLTSLPLIFGCPGSQIHTDSDTEERKKPSDAHVKTKYSAEAALMEIASVLELGERGTGMDTRTADLVASAGEIYNIPHQEGNCIVEEIFEFLELEDSQVKRRWWATESYWNLRNDKILELPDDGKSWHWTDDAWKIDCSGHVSEVTGGWESCKDLLGGKEGPLAGQRSFCRSHPFRRRRWFRARATNSFDNDVEDSGHLQRAAYVNGKGATLLTGLQAFHHPVVDSFSMAKRKLKHRKKSRSQRVDKGTQESTDFKEGIEGDERSQKSKDDEIFKISVKVGDGRWSVPAPVSSSGTSRGIVKVFSSRWPNLTKALGTSKDLQETFKCSEFHQDNGKTPYCFDSAPLSPTLYELVYNVSEMEGEWGEFSRLMLVSARFSVRNDSSLYTMEIKQAGARDETAVTLSPGETSAFFWADFRLPQLVCIRPVVQKDGSQNIFKWSGGFDVCRLGMTALMLRHNFKGDDDALTQLRTIRSLSEIRPGTGGTGINLSFKEENTNGDGALFLIENNSMFNIWVAQDGVLANPSTTSPRASSAADGDLVRPGDQISFGLDVPYRQGKYAHRKAATMDELLRIRIGLAPLSSHAGIETTKVIGLANVGETVRLKPGKLITILNAKQRKSLENVRVLAVTTADGPSRVLKFSLMAIPDVDSVLSSAFGESVMSSFGVAHESLISGVYAEEARRSAVLIESRLSTHQLPTENEAKRKALFDKVTMYGAGRESRIDRNQTDELYSVRLVLSGFLLSFVDSSPSEICTVTVNNVNAAAKWNLLRTADASFLMSIGWLQIDNHCPSAPFPVAFCPSDKENERTQDESDEPDKQMEEAKMTTSPFLVVGVDFAPSHSSGIVCLKSVTVAPRNVAVSLDLAFLVRLQRYTSGIITHLQQRQSSLGDNRGSIYADKRVRAIPLPDIDKRIRDMHDSAVKAGVGRQQVYFGALAILPYTVKLSIAPARALTTAQALFEGVEAAALHQAVRKGDLRLGGNSSPLDVRVGGKNTTAIAVVRGVVKSIVVDALLRLDGAALKFAGAFLRNQIFYGPQLATYLGAHYMQSLRQNVPALIGSLAFFGNPLGLARDLGEGVSAFVTEPVKGMKKSFEQLDPSHMVGGVARGTGSLARHTVGGFAASSALLTSTFSKNMAVLTLDRRYAQKRDRGIHAREQQGDEFYLIEGVESGFVKLAQGFVEGVTGVYRAPMRGAERSGFEGFAKGVGKGLLGLVVKPMIGISDAATDVMIGVRSSVEGTERQRGSILNQVRPRRALYGRDKALRPYNLADAAAVILMLRTRLGGQPYLSHLDMDDRVALLSEKRLLLLSSEGKELLLVKFKHISTVEVRDVESGTWGLLIVLKVPRQNGSELEVVTCQNQEQALELSNQIKNGMSVLEEML